MIIGNANLSFTMRKETLENNLTFDEFRKSEKTNFLVLKQSNSSVCFYSVVLPSSKE